MGYGYWICVSLERLIYSNFSFLNEFFVQNLTTTKIVDGKEMYVCAAHCAKQNFNSLAVKS